MNGDLSYRMACAQSSDGILHTQHDCGHAHYSFDAMHWREVYDKLFDADALLQRMLSYIELVRAEASIEINKQDFIVIETNEIFLYLNEIFAFCKESKILSKRLMLNHLLFQVVRQRFIETIRKRDIDIQKGNEIIKSITRSTKYFREQIHLEEINLLHRFER